MKKYYLFQFSHFSYNVNNCPTNKATPVTRNKSTLKTNKKNGEQIFFLLNLLTCFNETFTAL